MPARMLRDITACYLSQLLGEKFYGKLEVNPTDLALGSRLEEDCDVFNLQIRRYQQEQNSMKVILFLLAL